MLGLNICIYKQLLIFSDLSECQLMQVPDAVYHLMRHTELKACNLSSNVITKIPPKFAIKFSLITGNRNLFSIYFIWLFFIYLENLKCIQMVIHKDDILLLLIKYKFINRCSGLLMDIYKFLSYSRNQIKFLTLAFQVWGKILKIRVIFCNWTSTDWMEAGFSLSLNELRIHLDDT